MCERHEVWKKKELEERALEQTSLAYVPYDEDDHDFEDEYAEV